MVQLRSVVGVKVLGMQWQPMPTLTSCQARKYLNLLCYNCCFPLVYFMKVYEENGYYECLTYITNGQTTNIVSVILFSCLCLVFVCLYPHHYYFLFVLPFTCILFIFHVVCYCYCVYGVATVVVLNIMLLIYYIMFLFVYFNSNYRIL